MGKLKKLKKIKKKKRTELQRTFVAEFTAPVPKGDLRDYQRMLKSYIEEGSFYGFKLKKVIAKKHKSIGRTIGDKFERKIAKQLSLWWTRGADQYVFVKRRGSGGSRPDKTGESGYGGDIHADKPIGFPFVNVLNLELKNTKDMDPSQLLVAEGKFMDAWRQCNSDAARTKREPCLIYKREKVVGICFRKEFFKRLNTLNKVSLYEHAYVNILFCWDLVILSFDDFLKHTNPDDVFKKKGKMLCFRTKGK